MIIAAPVVGLEVLVLALMALLLVFALRPLIAALLYGLANALEWVPVAGGDIAQALRGSAEVTTSGIESWFGSLWTEATRPIVTAFDTIAGNLRAGAFSGLQSIHTIALGFEHLVFDTLHLGEAALTQWTIQSFNAVTTWASGAISQVEHDIVTWVNQGYSQLSAWMSSELGVVHTDIHNLAAALDADIGNLGVVITNGLADTLHTAEAYAGDVYNTAVGYTADAINGVEEEIRQDYDALAGSITATQQWAQGELGDIRNVVAGNEKVFYDVVAGSVIPAIEALAEEAEQCLKPMCNKGPDFMRGIESVLELLGGVAFFGLVAEAVKDPEGTAHAIGGEVEELARGAAAPLEAVLGFRL